MSWVSDRTGIHLGNIGAPVGAAIGSIIPGVGTALGAALGQGLGALGSGKSVGQAAVQGAGTYGIGKAIGAIPGMSGVGNAVGGALEKIPGVSGIEQFFHDHPEIGNALGAGDGGVLGKVGGLLTGNHGMNALGAAGAVNAALLQNKANEYAKNALGAQQQAYNERAPLRTGGIQAMQSAMAANPYSGTAMPPRQPSALGMNPGIRPVTLGGGY